MPKFCYIITAITAFLLMLLWLFCLLIWWCCLIFFFFFSEGVVASVYFCLSHVRLYFFFFWITVIVVFLWCVCLDCEQNKRFMVHKSVFCCFNVWKRNLKKNVFCFVVLWFVCDLWKHRTKFWLCNAILRRRNAMCRIIKVIKIIIS